MLISVAAHTIAVAYAPHSFGSAPHPVPAVATAMPADPSRVQPPSEDSPPVEIVLLEDEPVDYRMNVHSLIKSQLVASDSRMNVHASINAGRPSPGDRALSTGAGSGTETAAPTAGTSLMRMRKPEMTGVSGDFMKHFLENSKPLVRPPDIGGDQIENDVAAIDAHLHDREFVENAAPESIANMRIARAAAAERRGGVELHAAANGTHKTERQILSPYVATVARDGTVKIEDTPNFQLDGIYGIGLAGHFDLTDAFSRGHGDDPYAAQKLAFLDRTRDARVEIGRRRHADVIKQTPQLMLRNLDRLWATVGDLSQRKETLFELWDECTETDDAGTAARAQVLAFITARKLAYTPAELAAFNAKRASKVTFAP